ncbi:hypothetical protein GPECTOR_56g417 [Gonium pectorale]|uniref:Uncharacterized protein n=1 Tax=Gonium pectorale TaxID=33097 RepID=A0A150G7K2_GONPE|nr:hypothetical protein GPECTOR_56g417 [Gonium pectorale]|eukprot:KXZ45320.1 hypothetical protein GPECTOR_56g417 [Gonium pectorale]
MVVPTPGHTATTAARIWIPSIIDRIARFLPRNEVACSLRVVDKATAAMLRTPEFTTVRLSEPVPHHAFSWRWGRPGSMRDLTRARRRELVCLTAASGATANLALAVQSAGCGLTDEVGYAAGKAGQLGSCALLAELGCDMGRAVDGAAAGGHLALCEELTSWAGVQYSPFNCAMTAAGAGHTHILEWMVRQCELPAPHSGKAWDLARAVAQGCGLAALQHYHAKLIGPDGAEEEEVEEVDEDWLDLVKCRVVAAAAGSPTSDWRAKVEWLEAQSFPQPWDSITAAAKRPDALERLTWLAQRGYPRRPAGGYGADAPLVAAAAAGNAAAVLFLAEGLPADEDFEDVWSAAAEKGHIHVLQALHAAGRRVGVYDAQSAANAAARSGHLHVVAWLVETPGLEVVLDDLFKAAAASGSVELLAWLRERGCPWGWRAFSAAAEPGCVAVLEWLAERGCPMSSDGRAFIHAVREEDFAMLECLRRLGCPWGPTGYLSNVCFGPAFGDGKKDWVRMLSWLVAAGCPINWPTAIKNTTAAVADAAGWAARQPASKYRADLLEQCQRAHAWVTAEAHRHQR